MQLHWHRRDLRASDNRALAAAADAAEADDGVVSLFVFDPGVLEHAGPPRVSYLLESLAELREWYRDQGGDLLVRRGDPEQVVADVAREIGADRVVWNRDYSGLARERDSRVRMALDEVDIPRESFHDAICHEPGSITTNQGDPYSVFTYFGRKWQDREKDEPYPAPDAGVLVDSETLGVEAGELLTLADLGFDDPEANLLAAGTEAARKRLNAFCEDGIYRYDDDRDYPTKKSTSRLSVDLKYGTIGIREVYWRPRRPARMPPRPKPSRSTSFSPNSPGASFTHTCCGSTPKSSHRTTRSTTRRSAGRTTRSCCRRGKTATRGIPSSTPGCDSSERRGLCTTESE